MKRWICVCMVMVSLMSVWPVSLADGNTMTKDWNFYLISDSDTRYLTKEEIWQWDFDSLWYLINEIFARHGFVFKEGGQFYSFFNRQKWYTPNQDTTANKLAYSRTTDIDWYNEHLIKEVREEMLAQDTKNDVGTKNWRDFIPPENMLEGFENAIITQKKALWPVYSAPTENAWRGANGKATVNANYEYWAAGWDQGWLMVLYETNSGSVRIGYVQPTINTGINSSMNFSRIPVTVAQNATLTDDPMRSNSPMRTLTKGETVTYLKTFYGYGAQKAWAYVETQIDGKLARGFVPVYSLDLVIDQESIDQKDYIGGNG